jgi:peptidoglycan-N-acetylglucosamine deacetylase
MVIHRIPFFIPILFPNFIWHKSRSEKKVYLTFDDGPVEGITDYVLDSLRQRNMKATFFMVGENVTNNPELAKRVVREGHQVGNHTYHHLNGWKTDPEVYLRDVHHCQRLLEEELQSSIHLFRPPYGKITRSQFQKIKESHNVVMWDVLSGDYDARLSVNRCLSKTKENCENGSVLVFHDQLKTKLVLKKILEPFLDFLIEEGYQTEVL